MQEVEKNAPTVEEALEAALAELGVSEQEAEVEIVQEPRSGLLGMGSQEAVVRVRARTQSQEDSDLDEQAEIAADFVEGLLAAIGIIGEVDVNDVDGVTYVEIWADDDPDALGLLIGKRGNTLESIQELARIVVHRMTGERCAVLIDVEDYRKRRRAQILTRAQDAAQRVKKSGRQEALEPMSAYERKLVHDAVAEIGGLQTASEGEEPERKVVIRRDV